MTPQTAISAHPAMVGDRPLLGGTALPEGLYVYQTMRTLGHRALHVARHLELLGEAAEELSGIAVGEDAATIGRRASRLLADNGYPADMPSWVTLRKYLSGETVLVAGDILPYRRLGVRTLHPRGAIVDYEVPFSLQPSSLTLAATEAARIEARRQLHDQVLRGDLPSGADAGMPVVLHRNNNGEILSADGSPLFVLADDCLTTPVTTLGSVELETVGHAATAAGVPMIHGRVDEELLSRADEVFFFDHRGITALSVVGRRPYMHIIAERIGRHLA